jgi:general secretion pathway protein A
MPHLYVAGVATLPVHFPCLQPLPGCSVNTTPSTPYEQLFQFFGLRENPFRSLPDMRFLFLGRAYETALAEMMFGIESHCGLLMLTGEPGTGKTLLLRRFLQWLGQRNSSSAYIFHSHVNSAGLFALIAEDFGIAVGSTKKSDVLAAIQKWLHIRQGDGDSPVIVIDEAQALSTRALNELCLLLNLENSNGKLVQVLLAGQTELDEKLRQPELRQLRQRVGARSRLPLLTLEETEEYVTSRIRTAGASATGIFSTETLQVLYSHAHGIPRVINLLCEKSLLAAYAERQKRVSPANVKRAASEFDLGYEPAVPLSEGSLRPSIVIPPKADPEPRFVAKADPEPRLVGSESEAHAVIPPLPIVAVPPAAVTELQPKPNVRVFIPKPAIPEQPQPEPNFDSARSSETPGVKRHVPQSSFGRYWSDVAQSFLRDCKYFFSAFRTQSARDGKVLLMKKYDLRRDLVAPVSRWLSKPVSLKGHRSSNSERRASHGK